MASIHPPSTYIAIPAATKVTAEISMPAIVVTKGVL